MNLEAVEAAKGLTVSPAHGCGYGTFTLPVARRISGVLETIEIEPAMVERTRQRAHEAGLWNVECERRDVMAEGFGGAPVLELPPRHYGEPASWPRLLGVALSIVGLLLLRK